MPAIASWFPEAVGDLATILLLTVALAAVFFERKISDQMLICDGALAGLMLYPLLRPEWIFK